MTSARVPAPAPLLPERLSSLDGLRGVAAVVVLVHHALLTVPYLSRAYYPDRAPVPEGSAAWWLAYTPLHLVWAGTEAVFLFFVLSGLVVTLPAVRSARFDWVAFYPRRIVRIYGPVACALAVGAALAVIVPRVNDRTLGHWMNLRPNTMSPQDLLSDLLLVEGTSGVVSPLWSLQWEMLFSAFLPLFAGLALFGLRRPRTALALVSVALVLGSVFAVKSLFFLSLFAIGALLVAFWGRLVPFGRRVSRHRAAWPSIVAAGLLSTSAVWWAQGLGLSYDHAMMLRFCTVPGVVALLLAAAFWRPAVRLLDSRVFQWLGRISFSLYLVHEPIVTASRLLLVQVDAPTWVSIGVALPLALVVAALFARFVEQPFHRLARRVGDRAADASRDHLRPQRPQPEPQRPTSTTPARTTGPAGARSEEERLTLV